MESRQTSSFLQARTPTFPQARTSPPTSASGSSVGSAHCDNILRNFRQEDVVYALMTQLREKESELTMLNKQRQLELTSHQQQITEQTNKQLQGRIDSHNKAMAEKDTKIAVLEQKLAQEKKGNGAAIQEANLKHLTETNSETNRILQERDDELSQLRPILKELKAKVNDFQAKDSVKYTETLEGELDEIKGELATIKEEQYTTNGTIEELEKKIKGKEWMIKSLQEESVDQRSRENHLLTHIQKLNEKIDTYETKFKGKNVDVPLLLAKLRDYEARTRDLQDQVRRLTNKKLNELVLRSSPVPHLHLDENDKKAPKSKPKHVEDEADNDSEVSDEFSFLEQDEDTLGEATFEDATLEEATYTSNMSEDLDDPFGTKPSQEEDVLGDLLSDVKAGIEFIGMDSLCCVQQQSPVPLNSPVSYETPSFQSHHNGPPSISYQQQLSDSSRTFNSVKYPVRKKNQRKKLMVDV